MARSENSDQARFAALWAQLRTAGLVEGDLPPAAEDSPWYVQLILGVSAWFAALCLMAFFGVLLHDLWNHATSLFVVGGLCCAGAVALLRAAGDRAFLGQFAVPFSLCGQAMIAAAVGQSSRPFDDLMVGGTMVLIGSAMAAAAPHVQNRFLSAGMAMVGGVVVLQHPHLLWMAAPLLALGAAGVWLGARCWLAPNVYAALRPVGHAFVVALLLSVWFANFDSFQHPPTTATDIGPWAFALHRGAPYLVVVWLASVVGLLRIHGVPIESVRGAALLVLAAVLSCLLLPAPGVIAALLLLVLGFAAAERGVLVAGMLGVLFYLSRYYYELDVTLLAKSGVLAASGVALLGAWARMALGRKGQVQ